MKTVTMLEFRQDAAAVLKRLARGERLILSHRGKPAARLEPIEAVPEEISSDDPFLTVATRARPSPHGPTSHDGIDSVLYGSR